jgi:succinate dehydrogenase / fumarate reductase cytochrome b subunit
MVLAGFQHTWISVFYVVAMFLLCGHLAHGVSSAFQSLGIRSESWRVKLELAAKAYAWLIFVGFSIVPLLVLAQNWGMIELFDTNAGMQALALN